MANANVTLNASASYTNNTDSQTPLNRAFAPIIYQATTVWYNPFFMAGTIQGNLSLPTGEYFNAVIIKNLSASATVSIYVAAGAVPASPSCILGPGGIFMLVNSGVAGTSGLDQLQVLASAADTPIEYLVAY